jgi:hypothetical protein
MTTQSQNVWSWRWESNPQPADYKSAALPLSYASESDHYKLIYIKNQEKIYRSSTFFLRGKIPWVKIIEVSGFSVQVSVFVFFPDT